MLHDKIALENHSHVATIAERIRNSTHWILRLKRRFSTAVKRLHDEHMAKTQQEF